MRPGTILGIYRERRLSPGKVREDAAILDQTLLEFSRLGYETRSVRAECLPGVDPRDSSVLSMAQSERSLRVLEGWHRRGVMVFNAVSAVRDCYREPQIRLLAQSGIPMPVSRFSPLEAVEDCVPFGPACCYWLKRGDVHALDHADVVKVASREELRGSLEHFRRHRVRKVLIQEHVEGRPIKFYGVGEAYFRAFYPSGEEATSRMRDLSSLARQSADALGLEIYGGDAILTGKGDPLLVDVNDWPSFSRCRESAARAIARYVLSRDGQGSFEQGAKPASEVIWIV